MGTKLVVVEPSSRVLDRQGLHKLTANIDLGLSLLLDSKALGRP